MKRIDKFKHICGNMFEPATEWIDFIKSVSEFLAKSNETDKLNYLRCASNYATSIDNKYIIGYLKYGVDVFDKYAETLTKAGLKVNITNGLRVYIRRDVNRSPQLNELKRGIKRVYAHVCLMLKGYDLYDVSTPLGEYVKQICDEMMNHFMMYGERYFNSPRNLNEWVDMIHER